MLSIASHGMSGCAAALLRGPVSDDEWRRYIDWFVTEDTRHSGRETVLVVIGQVGASPNATWRREIATASERVVSKPLFLFVSESPVMRAVITAINWLRPPSFEFRTCASVAEALDRVAELRPRQLEAVRTVVNQVLGGS